MAEATDRPADKVATAPIPEAPPAARDDAPRVYSTVSLVAVLGFGLAVLYAATVGVGALIALFHHTPWILPIWMFALPVVAAAVCLAARSRIRSSEGALTGARLATWGVGLAAVVGLLYAAYYGGSYMAVSSQATRFADQWMDHLKKGQFDQAFLYTLPPPRPADDAGLRDRLEMDFDRDPAGHGGRLTSFRGSDLVRQFEAAGDDAQVQFIGVQGWGYDKNSYMIDLVYRITGGGVITDLDVTAVGVDDENGERQWFAEKPHAIKNHAFTAEGVRMQTLTVQAREFGQDWLNRLVNGDSDEVYLQTLPPADRERQRKERGPTFDEGKKAFLAGALVHYDPEKFWTGAKQPDKARQEAQQTIAGKVRAIFKSARGDLPAMAMAQALPLYHLDGDKARVAMDMIVSPDNLVIQSRLVLTADVGQGDVVKENWRVESLELLTAKTSGTPPGPPNGPGGQFMPPRIGP